MIHCRLMRSYDRQEMLRPHWRCTECGAKGRAAASKPQCAERGRRETLGFGFAGLGKLDDFPGRRNGEPRLAVAKPQQSACLGERIDHSLHRLALELRVLLDVGHVALAPKVPRSKLSRI